MKRKNADDLFSDLLRNDRVGQPAKEVEDRLMYSFLLKSSTAKPRQNSFAGFAGWVFSGHGLVVLFFTLFNSQFTFDSGRISAADTINSRRVLLADTTLMIQNIDSIRADSLN
jgi:hypothetical protein